MRLLNDGYLIMLSHNITLLCSDSTKADIDGYTVAFRTMCTELIEQEFSVLSIRFRSELIFFLGIDISRNAVFRKSHLNLKVMMIHLYYEKFDS